MKAAQTKAELIRTIVSVLTLLVSTAVLVLTLIKMGVFK